MWGNDRYGQLGLGGPPTPATREQRMQCGFMRAAPLSTKRHGEAWRRCQGVPRLLACFGEQRCLELATGEDHVIMRTGV